MIRRCLDSVFAQKVQPHEVIIVNDGSTDDSAKVVAEYGRGIKYFEQANQGPAVARSLGIEQASGQYLALIDADDYWQPTFLERTWNFLQAHPEAVAVNVAQTIKLVGKPAVTRPAAVADGTAGPERVLDNFFDFWALHDHVTTGSVLIRMAIAKSAGGQRSELRICEDLEYWGYLATFGPWGFIPEPLFVSDGFAAAAAQGWIAKHHYRWKSRTNIEYWQERIVGRLREEDWPGFRQYRGRVAKGFAYNRLLGGDSKGALKIVKAWGETFPPDKVARVLNVAAKTGYLGWLLTCCMLSLRESLKGMLIYLKARKG